MNLIEELQAECGYSEYEDGPVDALIEYKNALEDRFGCLLSGIERIQKLRDDLQSPSKFDSYEEKAEALGAFEGAKDAYDRALDVLQALAHGQSPTKGS